MKPSRWTAEWVWLGDLLLQHQEMDTKMLERAATTPQTEQGQIPLLLTILGEETQFRFFFLSY